MNILYAIQGTGNGHVARALDIIPVLKKYGNVDILISGIEADIKIPFEITYKLYGLSFIFGSKGGVDILQTLKKLRLFQLFKDIKHTPVQKYDLVINDFEPITAWACKLKKVPCISLSHQSSILQKNVPRPDFKDLIGYLVLKYYAPSKIKYGIHFQQYNNNIFTPVIRKQVREIPTMTLNHCTVYLPAYCDEHLISIFEEIPFVDWHIFSKRTTKEYKIRNVKISPVSNQKFIESMAFSTGVICGAGFETPAEALYLNKKLIVVPMRSQYEQKCNAAALKKMNVPVLKKITKDDIDFLDAWTLMDGNHKIDFPNNTESIVDRVIEDFEMRKNYFEITQHETIQNRL